MKTVPRATAYYISISLVIFALMVLVGQAVAQESKTLPDPRQKQIEEINAEIESLQRQLDQLDSKKKELERQRTLLLSVAQEPGEIDPLSEIRFPVVRVASEQTIVLLMNGREQEVYLSGVSVKLGRSGDAVSLLNRELAVGRAYARCLNQGCTEARLYAQTGSPSLNCKLLDTGVAFLWGTPLNCSDDDVARIPAQDVNLERSTEASGSDSSSNSPSRLPGTEVKVKGYYRKDGTYVRPHTRSAPRRRN